ncbi:SGNH/GDSL hydrolase family protein [Nocardioides daejeonensis]|uniref:SGNH/GDSL hydrolase family protein n=1 Tax=Nocardioides daejeonensis TaxID=1046556 RepID=UPI000D74DDDC|nr:SGNH/GDSL hydrolase family protein [Nocardioides daejeonensis]
MVSFQRYVALGDSFTEGVGDPDPRHPNGLRGWADRVAEQLARHHPDFRYANLAIRGRKLPAILEEQIEPALAMQPDLVTIYAGGNDMLRPKVDLDGAVAAYDEALGRLAGTGARLLVWTAFDAGPHGIFGSLRGRFALYNELVRESADRYGATVVDFWRMREYRDWRYWDTDRLHMGPAGHQRMAQHVLETLGIPHAIDDPLLPPLPLRTAREQRRENLDWARTSALPWVHRRLTGRSSGDTVTPKRPTLAPIE